MKHLVDDTMSTRPLSSMFYTLAGSGQIEGRHLGRDRARRFVDRAFWFFAVWCGGLLAGYAIWGWRP